MKKILILLFYIISIQIQAQSKEATIDLILQKKIQAIKTVGELRGFVGSDICYYDGSFWKKKFGDQTINSQMQAGNIVVVSTSYYWERVNTTINNIVGLQSSLDSKSSVNNTILTGTTKPAKIIVNSNFDNGNIFQVTGTTNFNGNVGFGTATIPGELFHIGDGNMLLEGGGEVAQKFKRDFTTTGENLGVPTGSGTSTNPIFSVGRIIQAGDGDPELRFMYADDSAYERTVFEVDRKGIVASVKTGIGSHFEGFKSLTDINPMFRLNSYPRMRLEMGPGGNGVTDVAVERNVGGGLSLFTNLTERVIVGNNGNVRIGTTVDDAVNKLQINGTIKVVQYNLSTLNTAPSSANAAGTVGEVRWTNGYIYLCVATNTWQRSALTTW